MSAPLASAPALAPAGAVDAGPASAIPPGGRRIVQAGKVSIGVFNVGGTFYAIRDFCPHEGAALCRGRLSGTNLPVEQCGDYQWGREGMILRCPWHGWEFDLETGCALFDAALRVKTYAVEVRDGTVWIHLKTPEPSS